MSTDLTADEISLAEAEREVAAARQCLAQSDAWLAELAELGRAAEELSCDSAAFCERRAERPEPTEQDRQDFVALVARHREWLRRLDGLRTLSLLAVEPRGSA
jgi:hypothetical protein